MISKNKKAVITTMQIALLSVASMLVLSIFLYNVYEKMKDDMSMKSCKSSISAHSFVAKGTSGEFYTDIKCPTEEITIKDIRDTKKVISEDMHRCWYIWGQGQGQYFEGDGSFCHVCSIYQFGDKRKTVTGLMHYLGTEPIKVKYPGDIAGTTYADYFMATSTPRSASMVEMQIGDLSKTDIINTSQRYATIFVYASGKEAVQKMLEGGGRTTLGAVGMLGVLGGAGGATAALFVASNPVGWVVGGIAVAGLGVAAIYEALHVTEPESVQFIVFRPYNAEELSNIGCEKIEVNQMSNTAP